MTRSRYAAKKKVMQPKEVKPKTAYQIWYEEHKEKLRLKDPGMNPQQVLAKAAEDWKNIKNKLVRTIRYYFAQLVKNILNCASLIFYPFYKKKINCFFSYSHGLERPPGKQQS